MRKPLVTTLALLGTSLGCTAMLTAQGSFNATTPLLLDGAVAASPNLQDSDTAIRLGRKGGGKTWRGSIGDLIEVTYSQRGSDKVFKGRLEAYREISRTLATMTVVGTNPGTG